jgi:hypothetical protein
MQQVEPCKIYCETHYYYETGNKNFKKLSKRSEFYSSLVNYILETNPKDMRDLQFLTCNFIYSDIGLVDLMAVLALMDLPWQSSPDHSFDSHGERGIQITPRTNMLLYKKELEVTSFDCDENIMVIHRFFDEGNKNSEMKITEFLPQRVYGCEVIITNVSSSSQELQCLWQVPEGTVPLKKYNYQKSESLTLNPYSTETYEFYFYFPKVGEYVQFPSNISSGGKVIAKSREYKFKVVAKKDSSSFERFSDLALSGDKEAILKFLKNENLFELKLKFHMKYLRPFLSDKKFYDRAIKILRERRIFGYDMWKYSFKHFDLEAVREFFETEDLVHKSTGTFFESSLIKCRPEKVGLRYLDVFPLVNPRAHSTAEGGAKDELIKFLLSLIEKDKLDDNDYLILSSYFLMQDRVEESLKVFKKVDPTKFTDSNRHNMVIQYDYLSCYFDILTGYDSGFKIARKISKKYEDYPVISWRMLFTEIIDQLKEFDGEEGVDSDIDPDDIDKKHENAKKTKKLEPTLEFVIEDGKCNVDYTNVEKVDVKYYIVNPEILFTSAPFMTQNTSHFSYVKPVYKTTQILPPKSKNFVFDIHKDYLSKNILIELDCGKLKKFQTYFACSLKVAIIENYAELKVTNEKGSPVPKVYIKCFSKNTSGAVKFFKDGYTDMRGKFEYGFTDNGKLTNIDKLSILVLDETHGSTIKECKLPQTVVKDADIAYLNARQAQKYAVWSTKNKTSGMKGKKKKK